MIFFFFKETSAKLHIVSSSFQAHSGYLHNGLLCDLLVYDEARCALEERDGLTQVSLRHLHQRCYTLQTDRQTDRSICLFAPLATISSMVQYKISKLIHSQKYVPLLDHQVLTSDPYYRPICVFLSVWHRNFFHIFFPGMIYTVQ